MYAEGITKILNLDSTSKLYGDIEKLKDIADTTNHNAFSHNGRIHIREGASRNWIESPFTMDDFRCK